MYFSFIIFSCFEVPIICFRFLDFIMKWGSFILIWKIWTINKLFNEIFNLVGRSLYHLTFDTSFTHYSFRSENSNIRSLNFWTFERNPNIIIKSTGMCHSSALTHSPFLFDILFTDYVITWVGRTGYVYSFTSWKAERAIKSTK